MVSLQTHRHARIYTPLGEDVLRFYRMRSKEALGRLSEFDLVMFSSQSDIEADDILGKNITIEMDLGAGGVRHFNGYVGSFAYLGAYQREHQYHAVVYPWLWLLTRSQDCKVFKGGIEDILKAVFQKYGALADYRFDLSDKCKDPQRDFCVQYRESDFNFVSRLMEHEGIYYFFEHKRGKHTLVITDSHRAHRPYEDYESIPYAGRGRETRSDGQLVYGWNLTKTIQPGAYAVDNFDFARPSAELLAKSAIKRKHQFADQEVFDYPGAFINEEQGARYAQVRIEELQARHAVVEAESDARGLCVGSLFKLTHHPRADQNQEYLVTGCEYMVQTTAYETTEPGNSGSDADGAKACTCRFKAIGSRQQFRAERVTPRPVMRGPQTAVVVGPKGDEIFTDPDGYARVRVQFHWDRYGKMDENSSYWIRVSQPWAGKGWGGVSLPRIGQEVVVDFLEGDPDQPIITGRVYNGTNKPPYATGIVSGLKSQTHKGQGYNEISMDDTAGKEKMTFHAQYDMDTTIEHDETHTINNGNRTITVKTGAHTETIKGNADITVQSGNYSHTVETGTASSFVKSAVDHTYEGTFDVAVKGGVSQTFEDTFDSTVAGLVKETYGEDQETAVTGARTLEARSISFTAAEKIELTVGGSNITIDPKGVTITAPIIKLN